MKQIEKIMLVFILSLLMATPLYAVGEGIDMPVFNKTLDQFQAGTKPNIGWWQYQQYKHLIEEAPALTLTKVRIRIEDQGIPNLTLDGFRTETKYNIGGYAYEDYKVLLADAPQLENQGALVPASHYNRFAATKTSGAWQVETIFGQS